MDQQTVKRLLAEGLTFAYPLRPYERAKIDATFLDPDYYTQRGTWHRGIDLNGVAGGDSDLGWPVQSMFPGEVVGVTDRPGWGNVVLVRSDTWVCEFAAQVMGLDLEVLDVQYAHLTNVSVKVGDMLRSGDHLGGIGKGDNDRYVAHLHLEVRYRPVPTVVYQGHGDVGYEDVLEDCLDPETVLAALPFTDFGSAMAQRRQVGPVRRLEVNQVHVPGESVTVTNLIGNKMYLRDDRTHAPKTALEALSLAIRLLTQKT